MDITCDSSELAQWLRQARLRQGLSEDDLARPEFSGNYIQAVEQGRMCPSPQALAVLASRLGLPLSDLLPLSPPMPSDPDLGALSEDLAYQMDHVKRLIVTSQGDAALALMNAAAQTYEPYLAQVCAATRCRFYRLRGLVHLRLAQPAQAETELRRAARLAQRLNNPYEITRVRSALGTALRQQGRVREALTLHSQCLHLLLHNRRIRDLGLRVSVYGNLADDHWALNDAAQAIGLYHETLRLLEDINAGEWQAHAYWGLSLAYQARRDLSRATLYAAYALDLYEAAKNTPAQVALCTHLAAIMIERREFFVAECWLARAGRLLENATWPKLLAPLYEHYAALELARGRDALAAEHAYHCLRLGEAALRPADDAPRGIPGIYGVHLYARALRIVGRVEEQRGRPQIADEYFAQAIAVVQQGGYTVMAYEIERAYAELLHTRGAYDQATTHYQAALQHRPRRVPARRVTLHYG